MRLGHRRFSVLIISVVSPVRSWRVWAVAFCLASLLSTAWAAGSGRAEAATAGVHQDVAYGSDPAQAGDVYVPSGTAPFPAVVTIHGGGFIQGTRSMMDETAQTLVQAGYVVYNIDYRLAPQFPYPAPVDDCRAAVSYLRQHAKDFGVDPARIGILGGSAGANLAAMVGVLGEGPLDQGSRVAAVVSLSAPFDLADLGRLGAHVNRSYVGPAASDEQIKAASPVTYVSPGDPPMLMANGTHEMIPEAQPEEMAAAYKSANLPYQLLISPAMKHAEHLAPLIYPQIIDFLDANLKGSGSTSTPSSVSPPSPPEPSVGHNHGRKKRDRGSGLVPIVIVVGLVVLALAVAAFGLRRRRPTP